MIRLLTFIMLFTLIPAPIWAQEKLDIPGFEQLPILHEGRIKPIDSFATIMLKTFSSRATIDHQSASEWLAESIFDPASAVEKPVFKIFDARHYGLIENKEKLYSYLDVAKIIQEKETIIKSLLEAPDKNWTAEQKSLILLHDNFILYTQILRSLTMLLPLDNDANNNFINNKNQQSDIEKKVKNIIKRKGTDLEKYTEEEKEIAALSYRLNILEKASQNNVLLRLIPENWNNKNTNWLSFWESIQQDQKDQKTKEYMGIWQELATSYRTNNTLLWDQKIKEAQSFFPTAKLKTEIFYNKLHLLQLAEIFYMISFALIILGYFFRNKNLEKISFFTLLAGLLVHTTHIALRVYILDRPPVGTLYESILFVSLISVMGCAYLSHKQKTSTGTLLGSISGIILLITAQGFTSEDTMATLVAVLNTNFWLGTHVLCISIGYGVCLITSLMAHYYLVQRVLNPNKQNLFPHLMRNLKTLAILSLLFTIIGTILGGIWADQSWGRFWGWDPKENGALLIVLWLIWLLHGRISQHINDIGFVIGSAFLSVVVVMAWFGVNLLNVGLHSYGFITGVATAIAIFCALEALIIGGLWYLARQKGQAA